MKKITYIADIDQDVDDFLAVLYMQKSSMLKEVVFDPEPISSEGIQRKTVLIKKGIKISESISEETSVIFCGGALRNVLAFVKKHPIDLFVMNGGFAGCNVVDPVDELPKFKGKMSVRTYNFNLDVAATHEFLSLSENYVRKTVLVGKNVCHSFKNTVDCLWKDMNFGINFKIPEGKRTHDVLACHEGLAFLNDDGSQFCKYKQLYPFNDGLEGSYTKWGSTLSPTVYRKCFVAVGYKEKENESKQII